MHNIKCKELSINNLNFSLVEGVLDHCRHIPSRFYTNLLYDLKLIWHDHSILEWASVSLLSSRNTMFFVLGMFKGAAGGGGGG